MADLRHKPSCLPYHAPSHHVEDDPTPKDQAVYVPSVTPSFAMDVYAENWKRPMPSGVGTGDLNFLNPTNSLFRISHAMTSAGQALSQTRDCIITTRDRKKTVLICDSGGYQIAHGSLRINGDPDRLKILRWQEQHGDYAMTLDVPTGPVRDDPGYQFKSTGDCLAATLVHLAFYQKHRSPGKVALLNVLQGNSQAEADYWYAAVRKFPFEGWAFAGPLRHDFYHLCRRILIMAYDGELREKRWIHVLGTCELFVAVLLTALQRAINRHGYGDIRISFDTSSPFRILSYNQVYTIPKFDNKSMTMPALDIPDDVRFVGANIRWPWPSPLGDRMAMGDVCAKIPPVYYGSYRDNQSNHYMAHHNLAALCWATALANRVFDTENVNHQHTIARRVGAAADAIDEILASGDMMTLQRHMPTFGNLPHSAMGTTDDEERRFLLP